MLSRGKKLLLRQEYVVQFKASMSATAFTSQHAYEAREVSGYSEFRFSLNVLRGIALQMDKDCEQGGVFVGGGSFLTFEFNVYSRGKRIINYV